MRASFIHIEPWLREALAMGASGDVAEVGVWHGTTFMPMAELAHTDGRTIHAVDSFAGMAKPTAADGGTYPAGRYDVGGSATLRMLTKHYGDTVSIHEGYVPDILAELDGCRFIFVHLDLDHYAPSLAALRFLWPRMAPGGILACHDYYPEVDRLCTKALKEWMAESDTAIWAENKYSHHVAFRRG
jgi:hypothetical protein